MHTSYSLFVFLLSIVITCSWFASTDGVETKSNSTSNNVQIIRRKSPSRISPGGGRFSLMNSRFNRRPKRKHLDRNQMLKILGDNYDPEWMSIEEPPALANKDPNKGATFIIRRDSWPYTELAKHLKSMNLSAELVELGGIKILEDSTFLTAVENWLLNKASCPVKYVWEDIGKLFWPRYIRRGECASVPGTCSWPPGMHCVPSGTSTLQVLRWQCKVPKGKGRRRLFKNLREPKVRDWPRKITEGEIPANFKCNWISVPYPITTDCLCTC